MLRKDVKILPVTNNFKFLRRLDKMKMPIFIYDKTILSAPI